jgi:hypothetical protein
MQKLESLYIDGFRDAITLTLQDRHAIYLVVASTLQHV